MKAIDHAVPWGRKGGRAMEDLEAARQRLQHRQKVDNAKATMSIHSDTPGAGAPSHHISPKRARAQADYEKSVRHQNELMAQHILDIQKKSHERMKAMTSSPPKLQSLNAPFKKKEQKRIVTENKAYRQRISKQKASYSNTNFEAGAQEQKRLLETLSPTRRRERCLEPSTDRKKGVTGSQSEHLFPGAGDSLFHLSTAKEIQRLTNSKLPEIRQAIVGDSGGKRTVIPDPISYLRPHEEQGPGFSQTSHESRLHKRLRDNKAKNRGNPKAGLAADPYAVLLAVNEGTAKVTAGSKAARDASSETMDDKLKQRTATTWDGIDSVAAESLRLVSVGSDTRSQTLQKCYNEGLTSLGAPLPSTTQETILNQWGEGKKKRNECHDGNAAVRRAAEHYVRRLFSSISIRR